MMTMRMMTAMIRRRTPRLRRLSPTLTPSSQIRSAGRRTRVERHRIRKSQHRGTPLRGSRMKGGRIQSLRVPRSDWRFIHTQPTLACPPETSQNLCLSVHVFLCLWVRLCVNLSVCQSDCQSDCQSLCHTVTQTASQTVSLFCLSVCLPVCLSVFVCHCLSPPKCSLCLSRKDQVEASLAVSALLSAFLGMWECTDMKQQAKQHGSCPNISFVLAQLALCQTVSIVIADATILVYFCCSSTHA